MILFKNQMQSLIVSGKLPCTKDECATLAAIHLRIYELTYIKILEEEDEDLKKLHPRNSSKVKSENTEKIDSTTQADKKPDENTENIKEETQENKNTNETANETEKKELVTSKSLNQILNSSRSGSIVSHNPNINMPVLTNGGCESIFFYLKSCSCLSSQGSSRILTLKQLVSPSYTRSNDIMKIIKGKKNVYQRLLILIMSSSLRNIMLKYVRT